jgi:hypothetical protein
MAEPTPGNDIGAGMPRWVKVFGVIALVVVLLFVALMFFGDGRHGPRRHLPSGDTGVQTPPQGGRP